MAERNKGAAVERAFDAHADWFYRLTDLGFRPFALDPDGKPPIGWSRLAQDAHWQDQEEFSGGRGEIYDRWLEDRRLLGVVTGALGGIVTLAAYGEEGRRSVRALGISTPVMTKVDDITYFFLRHPVGQWAVSIPRLFPGVDLLGDGCWAPAPILVAADTESLPWGIAETSCRLPKIKSEMAAADVANHTETNRLHAAAKSWMQQRAPDGADFVTHMLFQLRHARVHHRGRKLWQVARAIAGQIKESTDCPPEFRLVDPEKTFSKFVATAVATGIPAEAAERALLRRIRLHGSPAPEDDPEPTRRFTPIPAGEFAKGNPPEWLVKGLLPRAALAVIYGASGAGKSFFALDLVAAIALGRSWRDRKVLQATVLYIAAEGAGGFRSRIRAYQQAYDVEFGEKLQVIAGQPNFLTIADPAEIIAEAKGIGAGLVVIDTLAQATPGGDENSAVDMGKALGQCRSLHDETGATVILVHHAGKDASRGARGWSGIRAACDAEIEVACVAGRRVAKVTKQKDGAEGAEFGFTLARVFLGFDADEEEIESCVVRDATSPLLPNVTVDAVVEALRDQPRREDRQSREWAGYAIAKTLALDIGTGSCAPTIAQAEQRKAIGEAIGRAIFEGLVERVQLPDNRRRLKWYIEVVAPPAQPRSTGVEQAVQTAPSPPPGL